MKDVFYLQLWLIFPQIFFVGFLLKKKKKQNKNERCFPFYIYYGFGVKLWLHWFYLFVYYIYIYIFYGSLILDSLAFIWDKSLCTKNKKFKLDTLPKIKLNLEAN